MNGFGPWAAIDKATGCWIGKMGLDELDDWPDVDKIEVGFELHQAWWGRGLATEGALAALSFGFEQHGLKRIISVTAATHAAARRVMAKAGLTASLMNRSNCQRNRPRWRHGVGHISSPVECVAPAG